MNAATIAHYGGEAELGRAMLIFEREQRALRRKPKKLSPAQMPKDNSLATQIKTWVESKKEQFKSSDVVTATNGRADYVNEILRKLHGRGIVVKAGKSGKHTIWERTS